MTDFNKLSPAALAAAAKGGIEEWGTRASVAEHIGYVEPQNARKGHYLKCHCGCEQKARFRAMFNGICMYEGCELSARRFAKNPKTFDYHDHAEGWDRDAHDKSRP